MIFETFWGLFNAIYSSKFVSIYQNDHWNMAVNSSNLQKPKAFKEKEEKNQKKQIL